MKINKKLFKYLGEKKNKDYSVTSELLENKDKR